MNISHFLRQYHPSLVSRNEDINLELVEFQNQVAVALRKYESAVDAATKINPDFTAEATRREQQIKLNIATSELQKAVDTAAQPYKAATQTLRQEIENSTRPATHKTEMGELTALLKAQEIRKVMMTMSKSDASQLLRSSVATGDRSVLDALDDFILPIVSAPAIELAKQTFIEKAMPDKVQALELAEMFAGSVGTTQRFIESAARGIADKAGLVEAYENRGESVKKEMLNLSDAEKSAFITENGLDVFKELIR